LPFEFNLQRYITVPPPPPPFGLQLPPLELPGEGAANPLFPGLDFNFSEIFPGDGSALDDLSGIFGGACTSCMQFYTHVA
jgi:hypothetical protein